MANTRELSQLASLININDETKSIRVLVDQADAKLGVGTENPIAKVDVSGDVNVSGAITATSFYGDGSNLSNIISGVGIQSAGVTIGTGVTTLNFVGAGNTFAINGTIVDISIAGGGGGVEGGESYWSQTSAGIHTLSNVGIGTTNPTSALTVKGNTSLETLSVSGVGTFLSSGLKIRNSANTFQYNITGGAITADRTLNIPVITGTDTLATLGLPQTFTTQKTFQGTLAASGAVIFNTTTSNINLGTGQGTGTFIIGGTSQTGAITLGRATTSQTTNIQAGVTASGNQKTINLGTGGASGSRTLITVGSATAGAASTVTIPSPTNLLIGAATSTGTASQPLQVSGGAYVSGNVGIGTTNPTSKLSVVGDGNFTGVVTATGGFNLGISSAGTPITSGPLTTLNFVGAGNTFAINGTTVDISVAGGGGGASVSISTEAPSDPNEGDLWYSSLLGRTFIYYGDDDGSQWVDASPFNIPEPDSTPAKTSGTFTATEGQTVFNYTYNPGFIDVFLNGIRLNSSEFTTNNGTSITLITPASLNDVLDVVEYTMGIGDTGPQGPQGAGGPLQNITQTTTNETLYPIIATGTGSTLPFITTTNDYFEFNPSSGTLITNQLKVVGVVTASTFFGDGENLTNITASYASSSGIATYATSSGIATYAATSGVSTVSQGLTGTPNITVGVVTSSSIKVENIDVSNKTVGISSTSSPTDTSANNSGIVIYGNTNKSLTYNNTKKSFEFNIPLATNETRVLSVAEKSIVVNGNTVNLSYTQSNSNIAICTNPSGNITLNVTDIPTTSDFDNHSLTFSVIVTSTGTARTCTAINLNGVSRTIKWIGGSLANALVGVTTTNGYIVQSFSGINTVGSASTTSNYEIFGSVSGAFI